MLNEYHIKLLDMLEELIPNINGKWFLSDGALLGLHRDKKLIDYDYDLDIYVLEDTTIDLELTNLKKQKYYTCDKIYNANNIFQYANPWLEYIAYKRLLPQYKNLNRAEITKQISKLYKTEKIIKEFTSPHIDIFTLKKEGDKYIYQDGLYERMYYLEDEIDNIEEIYYNGIAINIPSKTEVILERLYGDTWNIPDPNYQFD